MARQVKWSSPHMTAGHTSAKENPHWARLRRGDALASPEVKKWFKTLPEVKPQGFSVKLWGERANDAAVALAALGVDASEIEFPACVECGKNEKLYGGMCDQCEREGAEAERSERIAKVLAAHPTLSDMQVVTLLREEHVIVYAYQVADVRTEIASVA